MEAFRSFSQQAATGGPFLPILRGENSLYLELPDGDANIIVALVSATSYDDAEYPGDGLRSGFGRDLASRRMNERRRASALEAMDSDLTYKTRKRPRSHSSRQLLHEDRDPPVAISATKKPIRIGDSNAVWNFYQQRFRNCQQTACKLIAKAWVKAVEPKKQSHHPYTGKDEKAPDWWPKPWGTMKDERVRHKEPDHLYKKGLSTL